MSSKEPGGHGDYLRQLRTPTAAILGIAAGLALVGCSPAQGKEPTAEPVHSAAPVKPGVENAENIVQQPVEGLGASETASPTPEPTPSETASNVIEQEHVWVIDTEKLVDQWDGMTEEERLIAADEFFKANAPDIDFSVNGMDREAIGNMGVALITKVGLIFNLNLTDIQKAPAAALNLLSTVAMNTGGKFNPYETLKERLSIDLMYKSSAQTGAFTSIGQPVHSNHVFPLNLEDGPQITSFAFSTRTERYGEDPWGSTVTIIGGVNTIGNTVPAGGPTRVARVYVGDVEVQYDSGEDKQSVYAALEQANSNTN